MTLASTSAVQELVPHDHVLYISLHSGYKQGLYPQLSEWIYPDSLTCIPITVSDEILSDEIQQI